MKDENEILEILREIIKGKQEKEEIINVKLYEAYRAINDLSRWMRD